MISNNIFSPEDIRHLASGIPTLLPKLGLAQLVSHSSHSSEKKSELSPNTLPAEAEKEAENWNEIVIFRLGFKNKIKEIHKEYGPGDKLNLEIILTLGKIIAEKSQNITPLVQLQRTYFLEEYEKIRKSEKNNPPIKWKMERAFFIFNIFGINRGNKKERWSIYTRLFLFVIISTFLSLGIVGALTYGVGWWVAAAHSGPATTLMSAGWNVLANHQWAALLIPGILGFLDKSILQKIFFSEPAPQASARELLEKATKTFDLPMDDLFNELCKLKFGEVGTPEKKDAERYLNATISQLRALYDDVASDIVRKKYAFFILHTINELVKAIKPEPGSLLQEQYEIFCRSAVESAVFLVPPKEGWVHSSILPGFYAWLPTILRVALTLLILIAISAASGAVASLLAVAGATAFTAAGDTIFHWGEKLVKWLTKISPAEALPSDTSSFLARELASPPIDIFPLLDKIQLAYLRKSIACDPADNRSSIARDHSKSRLSSLSSMDNPPAQAAPLTIRAKISPTPQRPIGQSSLVNNSIYQPVRPPRSASVPINLAALEIRNDSPRYSKNL